MSSRRAGCTVRKQRWPRSDASAHDHCGHILGLALEGVARGLAHRDRRVEGIVGIRWWRPERVPGHGRVLARARHRRLELSATRGIDAVMAQHQLDALLFPAGAGAAIAAKPGYPTVIVPFGRVPNAPTPALPDGFDAKPTPFGVAFTAGRCSEPKLIGLAYAFEQVTKRRVAPLP